MTFDQSKKAADPLAASSDNDEIEGAGTLIAPAVRLITEGALVGGYDTDHDLRKDNTAGAFGLVDLGAAMVIGPRGNQTVAVVHGSVGYYDFNIRTGRNDAGALLEHTMVLEPHLSLLFGGFYLHDEIDINRADRASAYYELAYRDDNREVFWRGREFDTSYLARPASARLGSAAAIASIFDVDQTFNSLRSQQSIGALILKNQVFAPYVEVGYANLDYYKQLDPASPDRNANEIWGIGGVRVTLSPQLRAEVGVRYNERWFAGTNLSSHAATGFDAKLTWNPDDATSVEINFDHDFEEAFIPGALVTDRQALSLLAVTRLDKRTLLTLDGGLTHYDEVGTSERLQERYLEAKLVYKLDGHTELFGSTKAQSFKNLETTTVTEDYRLLVGIKIVN